MRVDNSPIPSTSWNFAERFHETRVPTSADEQTIRLAYALHRVDEDGYTCRDVVRDLARVPRD